MADFISFNQGQDLIANTGLLADMKFDLSTKSIDATTPFVETDTYATRGTTNTGTGYAQQTKTHPTYSGGTGYYGTVTWTTGANTDWSNSYRSVVMSNGTVIVCAWNLVTGGAVRDLSAANTTENFQPTIIFGTA